MDSQGDYSDEIVGVIGVFGGEVPYLKRGPEAKLYPGKWCIPSGHMKIGETTGQAARRELEEETGYRVPDGAKMEELGRFTYDVNVKGTIRKLKITLLLHIADEKPEVRFCDEHTEYKYISLSILSDKEKMFLYTHARGISDFTPIDFKVIDDYMPKAYDAYKSSIKSREKSMS